ncbi:Pyrroline-5-carboxylate reductase,related [Neospora caninum Liverpool]|uniref:Pyrroline-5-carboxylate reductase n=1 Tax=Neospora caninum (strain Liverpool) TaxID=572307 RepID=F0VKL0_NEOCL|nr:Pyrroline-5-carboxylate reductase,related [Neospora caninum Liverpool]CBZ54611.1 Pyrroline-5-carboxylate reductase,related [Neospora caninum Liverpool]CEL69326.1 TPA: Pyrroline-5-carboxylate reductase, related [Neospora caninum Liverpool]|eukprot:XP_003884641.1 Pyrroline-5-carboxylate reductase,related [Neospora caninum Liverpool]
MEALHKKIAFVGAGVMAFALAKGFVDSDRVKKDQVYMFVRNETKRSLVEDLGYRSFQSIAGLADVDIIVISVKPQDAVQVLHDIRMVVDKDKHLLISICVGLDIETLARALDPNSLNRRICRVMPNTPSQIRHGVSVFSMGQDCTDEDRTTVESLLSAVGSCYKVQEKHIAAAGAISGSGPAFIFTFLDALSDAGVKNGLPRKLAQDLAMDMVEGSAAFARVEFGRRHFAELKDQVTSPGGTTIAGIAALERWGFRNAIIQAIDATTDRAKDLGC